MLNARDQFARADRLVSEYKERIARQRKALVLAQQRGQSTAPAESVLRALHQSLRAFEKNRQLAFERMEAKRGPPNAPAVKREAEEERWTVPINVIVSKLSTFGIFPASYQFGLGGFVAHPEVGPSWKIRAAIVILLPRARK